MPEETTDTGSMEDLFQPSEQPAQPTAGYTCSRCGAHHASAEEMRFCPACGSAMSADGALASRRALLVDDSQLSRKKVAAILKRLGCEVAEAENGRRALEMARDARPDIIVLDVQMPVMDGVSTLKALRAEPGLDSIPIVMLTVEADSAVVARALANRATDYIRKDMPVADVLARLRKHIPA